MPRTGDSFTFIHCADLHLDSPFKGISKMDEGLSRRLQQATLQSLDRIIDLAIRESVDFILFAGDIFDSRFRSLRSRIAFREALRKASINGVQSFVAYGNHDHLGTDMGVPLDIEGVHVFGSQTETVPFIRDGRTLAYITGVSHGREKLKENLALQFSGTPGAFNIGLLHCNIGSISQEMPYAPCQINDLMGQGIDYWALGHIHKRQILSQNPWVVYAGNTQGRHINEDGAKGVYLVHVRHGRVDAPEFHAIDAIRWEKQSLDISYFESEEELVDAVLSESTEAPTLTRMELHGRTLMDVVLRDPDRLEDLREQLRTSNLWTVSIDVNTRPMLDLDERRKGEDLVAEVLRTADAVRKEPPSFLRHVIVRERGAARLESWLDEMSDEELLSLLEDAEVWCADTLTEDLA
jgi:DNA repair exonuclease SbcCD nuclease subunit